GSEVAARLQSRAEALEERIGAPLVLTAVVVRDPDKERPGVDASVLTTDAEAAIDGADIVIELMGGIEPAKTLITRALAQGSSVVTANKALLAAAYGGLMAAADDSEGRLGREAAV
ncbi:homoserine dehydrogenase, partial [Mycobacterium tuberculosis]|nr:homoserine dehydrogenase [Mycobacterium tuberculosis]